MIRRSVRPSFMLLLALAAFVWVNNTSMLVPPPPGSPTILAHRGIAQTYDLTGVQADTCTASRMLPPTHTYLENTFASIGAAFDQGADVVEIDEHPTRDGQFAVFHDWTLECRTDGQGITREHTLAELKTLDIGYGYTSDGGRTFPFRGQGIGLMPSLDEVFATFPGRQILINIKSNDPDEGILLANRLGALTPEDRAPLMVYGGDKPIATLHQHLPDLRTLSRASLQTCLVQYIGYGWTGLMPAACERSLILVPLNIAPWLWGWPNRFLSRMDSVGGRVFVLGPYHGGDFSAGLDTPEDLARLPVDYSGGIWTNELDLVTTTRHAHGSSERSEQGASP